MDIAPPDRAALLAVARGAVEARARGVAYEAPTIAAFAEPGAAFVTLENPDGSLRGCIGHLRPVRAHLAAEVADVAAAAAAEDPRFPPVAPHEVGSLSVTISILAPPQAVDGPEALDPARFGVIVSDGMRRGVLLPDLDGVDTVEQQLRIACRKAGIRWGTAIRMERFEVVKIEEA